MNDKSFCLRWNKYSSVFFDTFAYLWKSQELADVSIFCDGQEIRCHRLVLCACSTYFQSMLASNLQPNPIIFLCDIRIEDLRALIEFIYTGVVTVSQERLAAVVKAGEALKIKGLGESDSESDHGTDIHIPHSRERENSAIRSAQIVEISTLDVEKSAKKRRMDISDTVLPVRSDQKTVISTSADISQRTSELKDFQLESGENSADLHVKEEYRDVQIESADPLSVSENLIQQSSSNFPELASQLAEHSFEGIGESFVSPSRARVTNQGQDSVTWNDQRNPRVACSLCKVTVRKGSLRNHMVIKHGMTSNFRCGSCGRYFHIAAKLEFHVATRQCERKRKENY